MTLIGLIPRRIRRFVVRPRLGRRSTRSTLLRFTVGRSILVRTTVTFITLSGSSRCRVRYPRCLVPCGRKSTIGWLHRRWLFVRLITLFPLCPACRRLTLRPSTLIIGGLRVVRWYPWLIPFLLVRSRLGRFRTPIPPTDPMDTTTTLTWVVLCRTLLPRARFLRLRLPRRTVGM